MTDALIALLAFAVAIVVAGRHAPAPWISGVDLHLRHRLAPLVVGLVTAAGFWWVAGATLDVEPISTDEAAYLLQAEIFAHGKVTAPAPPIAEFFEQPWVLVTPRIVAKYPPGHSLILAPGVALGLPWLVPFLLNIVSGALLFGLLRRAIGPGPALLTWAAWTLCGMAMAWQTSYFSETTLLACALGTAACVWRWIDGASTRWLVAAALLTAYGASTRPLSILLLLLPVAVVTLRAATRSKRWRDVGIAALVGVAGLSAIPAWNWATTGRATRSPLAEYTETYLPFDRLGFAIAPTPPLRPTPVDLQAISTQLAKVHQEHTVAALPTTLLERARRVANGLFYGWRLILAVAVVFGLFRMTRVAWSLVAAAVAQFFGHAVWGHQAGWTIYYAESAALWFIPGAIGVACGARWLITRWRGAEEAEGRTTLAIALALPVLLLLSINDSATYRGWRAERAAESSAFSDFVRQGPDQAIYFYRYAEARSGRPGMIRNHPFLDEARAWIVYDRGAENEALLREAPGRTGYLVDEATRDVTVLPRATAGTSPTP